MGRWVSRWKRKFAVAGSGLREAVRTQDSFPVHAIATLAVLAVAFALRIEAWRWAAVLLAITVVWSAELLNTAIELLAKKLHPERDPQIGRALDAAAAGVLVAAVGSVLIGLVALGPPCWDWLTR